VTDFATRYIANHRPLPSSFEVTPDMLDDFKVFLSARNVQPNVADWSRDRVWITSRLKQEILTQAEGVAAGDQVEMRRDPEVQAALKAVEENRMAKIAANKIAANKIAAK
jgi:carboxyl-terminal processing protease